MKIGIVTSSLARTDGWGRYSAEIVQELSNYGQVRVVSHQAAVVEGLELYPVLPPPRSSYLNLVRCFCKVVRYLGDCDVIHCFAEPYAPGVALANLLLRKPLFITAHGTYAIRPLNKKGIDSLLMQFAYKRASKIISISSFTKDEILKKCDLSNVEVIPNGVNYQACEKGQADMERQADTIVLSVGAVKPRKGFDISVRAISRLKQANIKYYIAGDISNNSFSQKLRSIIAGGSLEGKVELLGRVTDKDLMSLYHTCDIFMLTPRNIDFNVEGFGLVYLEANACGKPVIGTYGCGAEEAIIDGYNGILVPQDNPEKTAEAIEYLLDNPEVAREMGENGRKRARELSWENIVGRITALYESALRGG